MPAPVHEVLVSPEHGVTRTAKVRLASTAGAGVRGARAAWGHLDEPDKNPHGHDQPGDCRKRRSQGYPVAPEGWLCRPQVLASPRRDSDLRSDVESSFPICGSRLYRICLCISTAFLGRRTARLDACRELWRIRLAGANRTHARASGQPPGWDPFPRDPWQSHTAISG